MSNSLAQIIIPQFITKVKTAKNRRAKYYKIKKNQSESQFKNSLPKKHKDKNINKNGYLIDENGKRVVSNPRTAGKARYKILSGNKLLSGYGSPHIRAKLARELKNFYRPYVQKYIREHGAIEIFPLIVTWDLYTTVEDEPNWDAGNLFFYYKYFEDCLFEKTDEEKNKPLYKKQPLLQLIPDDNVKYIIHPPGARICPIDNWEDRKFVFNFYHDDRPELRRKPWVS